jgi:hypothetical protein
VCIAAGSISFISIDSLARGREFPPERHPFGEWFCTGGFVKIKRGRVPFQCAPFETGATVCQSSSSRGLEESAAYAMTAEPRAHVEIFKKGTGTPGKCRIRGIPDSKPDWNKSAHKSKQSRCPWAWAEEMLGVGSRSGLELVGKTFVGRKLGDQPMQERGISGGGGADGERERMGGIGVCDGACRAQAACRGSSWRAGGTCRNRTRRRACGRFSAFTF